MNHFKGLSELLFNNKNVYRENFTIETNKGKTYDFDEIGCDNHINSKNQNSYILICTSRKVEYYVIDKNLFLNHMNETEKFFFQSQIENMVAYLSWNLDYFYLKINLKFLPNSKAKSVSPNTKQRSNERQLC